MPSLDFDLEESNFRAFYAQQSAALEDACAALTALVAATVTQAGGVDITKVEGRVKDADECIRKFIRKYRPALEESNTPYDIQSYITDLIGVRVVCLYEDELEKIAQIMRAHFAVIDVTDKVSAVESTEASFGYKGLHLDLRLSAAERSLPEHAAYAHLPFELQVRTIIKTPGACWTTASSTKNRSRASSSGASMCCRPCSSWPTASFARFATPPPPNCCRRRTKPQSPCPTLKQTATWTARAHLPRWLRGAANSTPSPS